MNKDVLLLVDGKHAFPSIIESIDNAKKSIVINMFIWRDDKIGNIMLAHVKNALDRGVLVTIDKDLYGEALEKSEETKQSMFHKKHNKSNLVKAYLVDVSQDKPKPKGYKQNKNDQLDDFIKHPNLTLKSTVKKSDHSKFYLIDGEVLFLGGINIEDKEIYQDLSGMVYHDYMIKITDLSIINRFKRRFYGLEKRSDADFEFIMNHKTNMEIKDTFFDLIDNAKKEIIITMAYMGHVGTSKRLLAASKRGVKVSILTSRCANLQDQINKKVLSYLFKASNGTIDIHLSDKMIHSKLLIADDVSTVGSANMNRTAYRKLIELNIYTKDLDFKSKLIASRDKEINLATKVVSLKQLKYKKFTAFLESFAV